MPPDTDPPEPRAQIAALDDVTFAFGEHLVLEHVSLTIREGDFLGIIGPNGGGKSVLLKVMLGLLEPTEGVVRLFGKPPRIGRRQVGYVPQFSTFDRNFPISVLDVVLLGRLSPRRFLRPYSRDDRARANEALDRVGLADLAGRQIGKLSGGQLQRVLIARALAVDSRLLVLDEPTSSLDPLVADDLYALLDDISSTHTVVLVTHDVGVISQRVEQVACVNRRLHYHPRGELTEDMLREIYDHPVELVEHPHQHRLLHAHDHSEPEAHS